MMASLLLWTHGTWPWEQRAAGVCGPSAPVAETVSTRNGTCSRHLKSPASLPLCPQVFAVTVLPRIAAVLQEPFRVSHSSSLCQTDEQLS